SGPCAFLKSRIRSEMLSNCERSNGTKLSAPAGAAAMASVRLWASLRARANTRKPSLTNFVATASPMPRDPPVTNILRISHQLSAGAQLQLGNNPHNGGDLERLQARAAILQNFRLDRGGIRILIE